MSSYLVSLQKTGFAPRTVFSICQKSHLFRAACNGFNSKGVWVMSGIPSTLPPARRCISTGPPWHRSRFTELMAAEWRNTARA